MKAQTPVTSSSEPRVAMLIFTSIGFALLLFIFVVYVVGVGTGRELKPIKLATGEWAPYSGVALHQKGIATAIVTAVLRDIGYQPEYQFMSWPNAEKRAAAGEKNIDIRGTFPYSDIRSDIDVDDGRSSQFYFSDSLLSVKFAVFYHILNNPAGGEINTLEGLAKHKVLEIAGYQDMPEIRPFLGKSRISVSDNLHAFKALGNSQDALVVIESVAVGQQLLEEKTPELLPYIRQAPLPLAEDLRLMLSKKNPNNLSLKRDFNARLKQFRSDEDGYLAFQEKVKKQIDMARAVTLKAVGGADEIIGYESPQKQKMIFLPLGSKAIVRQWDPAYLNYRDTAASQHVPLVKIKLLNGPHALKNKPLYIDARAVQLPNQ